MCSVRHPKPPLNGGATSSWSSPALVKLNFIFYAKVSSVQRALLVFSIIFKFKRVCAAAHGPASPPRARAACDARCLPRAVTQRAVAAVEVAGRSTGDRAWRAGERLGRRVRQRPWA